MNYSSDLDTPLITFGGGSDPYTLREAFTGVQVVGSNGSGKTSGSGRLFAHKYLSHGFGGLVLTVKVDERKLWEDYCKQAGRLDDLIVIEPLANGGKHTFNFLGYEAAAASNGMRLTENLIQVLTTVIRAGEDKSGGSSIDPFWDDAKAMLMGNTIDLCLLAYGDLSIRHLYNIAMAAPKKDAAHSKPTAFTQAFEAAQKSVNQQIEAYQQSMPEEQASGLTEAMILEAIPDAASLQMIDQFFMEHFRNLSDKTRSTIEFSFIGFLDRLLKEPVHSLFCNSVSTYKPEDCFDGKIFLIDLPVKIFHKTGRDVQILVKYIYQRAWEKRNITPDSRPLFLWADENQHFIHEHDAEFQATARSSRISTVVLSQNVANYHANMGGAKSEHRVTAFLGTLGTKIFHANADAETNNYASALIGEAYVVDESTSSTMAGEFSSSQSKSLKLEKVVRPEEFAILKTGGPKNNFQVEAYMHRQSNLFADGMPFQLVTFNQQ